MKTLGVDDVAAVMRIHPVTVRRRAASGDIPGSKPGKEWVFLEDDILEILLSSRTKSKKKLPPGRPRKRVVER